MSGKRTQHWGSPHVRSLFAEPHAVSLYEIENSPTCRYQPCMAGQARDYVFIIRQCLPVVTVILRTIVDRPKNRVNSTNEPSFTAPCSPKGLVGGCYAI